MQKLRCMLFSLFSLFIALVISSFCYAHPVIDFLNPYEVPGVSASKVRIVGSGFGDTQDSSQVHVGGQVVDPGDILFWSDTLVKCWLPEVFWNPFPTKDRWKLVWVTV